MYRFDALEAGGGGAALSRAPTLIPPQPRPDLARGISGFRLPAALVLVEDLGQNIASPQWLRGLATCAALCFATWSLAPALEPIPGRAGAPLSPASADEVRTLGIAPLALGAGSGRRTVPTDAVVPLAQAPEPPIMRLTATLGWGDGLAAALQRAGIGQAEAGLVQQLVADAIPAGAIRPGTGIEVTLGRRPEPTLSRPLQTLSFRARLDLELEIERLGDRLVMKRTSIAVDDRPLRIRGRVGPSLYRSARAAGAPSRVAADFIRAIATRLDIASIDPADGFDMVVEHRRAAPGESEIGKLLYAGLERSGGPPLQLMQWQQDGSLQWFEPSGLGGASFMLRRPVSGPVSSGFGFRRHPILGYSRFHKGIDFQAGHGTPILAVSDGQVSAAGWHGGYGKQVRISHAGGLMTTYSHMSRIVAQPGIAVRRGELIGYVGSTGFSTGPHLHYELYRNGVAINPAEVEFATRARLSAGELAAFRATLQGLLSLPPEEAPSTSSSR